MAKPAINSKGEYETKLQLWNAPSQNFLVLLLIFYYTQNSSSATPGHVHSFFSLVFPFTSGLLFQQSQNRF